MTFTFGRSLLEYQGEAIEQAMTMIIDYTCSSIRRKGLRSGENSAHKASPIERKFPTIGALHVHHHSKFQHSLLEIELYSINSCVFGSSLYARSMLDSS